jgi:hypothetical protein
MGGSAARAPEFEIPNVPERSDFVPADWMTLQAPRPR